MSDRPSICSFCGKHAKDVKMLVSSNVRRAFICEKCVVECVMVMAVNVVVKK